MQIFCTQSTYWVQVCIHQVVCYQKSLINVLYCSTFSHATLLHSRKCCQMAMVMKGCVIFFINYSIPARNYTTLGITCYLSRFLPFEIRSLPKKLKAHIFLKSSLVYIDLQSTDARRIILLSDQISNNFFALKILRNKKSFTTMS